MEEYFCNICEKSIEALTIESHINESDHVARKKILEEQLQHNTKFPKSLKSSVDLWKKD
ncbi:MAG TPA: hypothetical protein VE594_05060 [Nitrososphaeraceae archaeon]|jgi:hypothetical protein|nr:hypothetical protein [Nitrososphaeraceae archaeon]